MRSSGGDCPALIWFPLDMGGPCGPGAGIRLGGNPDGFGSGGIGC